MPPVFWFIVMLVFLLVEANTVALMSLWFAAGAFVAMILSACSLSPWIQVATFLVVSCALLACLRPFVRKFIKPRITKTNVDAIVGSQGCVTADIDNIAAVGQVKLGSMEWSARSTDGSPISAGTLVKVDRIEGVKAFVSAVEVKAESPV